MLYFVNNNTHTTNNYGSSEPRLDMVRGWDHFTRFGSLYFFKKTFRPNTFVNYFILATRGNIMVTSARAIRDLFCRLFGFFSLQPECLRWLFANSARQVGLARWFGWKTGTDVFIQLDRQSAVFCTSDVCYAVRSRYISYRLLYLIGCDIAIVLSSFKDDGRYLEFQNRGIPTVGFDDGSANAYTYGFPGGTGYLTILTYLRVLAGILSEVRVGHLFWHLQANRLVF